MNRMTEIDLILLEEIAALIAPEMYNKNLEDLSPDQGAEVYGKAGELLGLWGVDQKETKEGRQ